MCFDKLRKGLILIVMTKRLSIQMRALKPVPRKHQFDRQWKRQQGINGGKRRAVR